MFPKCIGCNINFETLLCTFLYLKKTKKKKQKKKKKKTALELTPYGIFY